MDEALVKHPKHDVHGKQRRHNEQCFIAADGRVGGSGPLEADDDAGRHIQARLCPPDRVDRLAERRAFCNIEGYSYHWELALVGDGERRRLHLEMGEGGERHGSSHRATGGGAAG